MWEISFRPFAGKQTSNSAWSLAAAWIRTRLVNGPHSERPRQACVRVLSVRMRRAANILLPSLRSDLRAHGGLPMAQARRCFIYKQSQPASCHSYARQQSRGYAVSSGSNTQLGPVTYKSGFCESMPPTQINHGLALQIFPPHSSPTRHLAPQNRDHAGKCQLRGQM